MKTHRFVGLGVAALGSVTVLAGCGSSSGDAESTGSATVTVVASTNVWGDVTKQIAGDLAGSRVQISSIITDPDADPHTYEASAQNQLAISKASVVIENGGGYDDFIDKMVRSAGSDAEVLNAVDISGKTAPAGGELNEHVWYDFPTVQRVAAQVVSALSKADPDDAATYQANEKAFDQKLKALESTESSIRQADAGDGVAITEPVPLYMLEACGLDNLTPAGFSEAIEEDNDVPASVLKQTLDLFTGEKVELLAYNEQTSGPVTEQVLDAAKANGVGVVPVTETLPEGMDYLTWMRDNLAAISSALG